MAGFGVSGSLLRASCVALRGEVTLPGCGLGGGTLMVGGWMASGCVGEMPGTVVRNGGRGVGGESGVCGREGGVCESIFVLWLSVSSTIATTNIRSMRSTIAMPSVSQS